MLSQCFWKVRGSSCRFAPLVADLASTAKHILIFILGWWKRTVETNRPTVLSFLSKYRKLWKTPLLNKGEIVLKSRSEFSKKSKIGRSAEGLSKYWNVSFNYFIYCNQLWAKHMTYKNAEKSRRYAEEDTYPWQRVWGCQYADRKEIILDFRFK